MSTQMNKPNHLVKPPSDAAPQFFTNLPPLFMISHMPRSKLVASTRSLKNQQRNLNVGLLGFRHEITETNSETILLTCLLVFVV